MLAVGERGKWVREGCFDIFSRLSLLTAFSPSGRLLDKD